MMDQRSHEWFAARLGQVTASRVADVMTKTRSGYGASRKNYMMELLCQRLTGNIEEGFTSAEMQRGTDLEPVARSAYELATGLDVVEIGFSVHPVIDQFGASPDGLVGESGLIEIKCPNTAQHVDFIRSGKPDGKYITQMQAQMACTGRDWCDFVSFDDRLPDALQFRMVRVQRDEEFIVAMEAEIIMFLNELADIENEMLAQMKKAA